MINNLANAPDMDKTTRLVVKALFILYRLAMCFIPAIKQYRSTSPFLPFSPCFSYLLTPRYHVVVIRQHHRC